MTSPLLLLMFREQYHGMKQIVLVEVRKTPKDADFLTIRPSRVLSFAEMLMLCPDGDSVIAHIRRDQEAAQVFVGLCGAIESAIEKGQMQFSLEVTPDQTPFLVLGYAVQSWVKGLLEDHPEDTWH